MAGMILGLAFDFIIPFIIGLASDALAQIRYGIIVCNDADFIGIETEVGILISWNQIDLQFRVCRKIKRIQNMLACKFGRLRAGKASYRAIPGPGEISHVNTLGEIAFNSRQAFRFKFNPLRFGVLAFRREDAETNAQDN